LVDEIIRNFSSPFPVEIEKQVEDVALDPKVLQSLGIIINEIITNIMKYAFIGRNGGKIILRAYREQERVYIEVADNGVGMDESITFEKTPGFGLMLIKILTEQLRGSIRIDRNGGTKIGIAFPATDA
jgi:two-component sensor histidine kinase